MKNSILCKSLQKIISGTAYCEKEFLDYYSVDASSYQIYPKIISFPKNSKDIQIIIKFAQKNNLSVTPRGAGTSLVGNSLNDGIIVDMKNFEKINISKNHVTVEVGVKKGKLDKILEKKKKFFPVNPSIGAFCTIGGMLGNNASGSRALKYGSTIDNLLEITFIDGNGKIITLPHDKILSKKIFKLSKSIQTKKFPKVTKNSCGYRLDTIQKLNQTAKIIAASEGTLGIILSAKLKILDIPKYRSLTIIEYSNEKNAAVDCVAIIKTMPSALEFVDKNTLKNIDFKFQKNTKCLLFVEYDKRTKHQLEKIITGKILHILKKKKDVIKWWRYRDSSLYYSLKSIQKNKRIPHIIEDAVVPVENLSKLFTLIQKINEDYKTKAIFYGHAGNGNIHVRLISNRKNHKILQKIAKTYFESVMKLGGSISGEHGDGLARSEFIKKQYGSENYKIFKKLKNIFDPENLLNPGKIISKQSTMMKNLEKI